MMFFLAMLLGPTIVSPLTGQVMQLDANPRTRSVAPSATFGQPEIAATTSRLGARRGSRVSQRNGARRGGGLDSPSAEAIGPDPITAFEHRIDTLSDPR
jgi:hypothetical protein